MIFIKAVYLAIVKQMIINLRNVDIKLWYKYFQSQFVFL
jgi:hypothetical protein